MASSSAVFKKVVTSCSCPTQTRIAIRWSYIASKRWASTNSRDQVKKKKKVRTQYMNQDLKKGMQFSLCDAMRYARSHVEIRYLHTDRARYIKAFEVGQKPTSAKYDLAVRLRTPKNSPVIRNRLRLSNPPDTSARICVICPADSPIAKQAISAGATLVGEENVFNAVKEGRIEFDRCICHKDSSKKLQQANLGRILGPKGMMPSEKLGTITSNIGQMVKTMVGATEYKETLGVIRCAVGQLGYTPEQLQKNIREFMASVKKDITNLSDQVDKGIHEVVCLLLDPSRIPCWVDMIDRF